MPHERPELIWLLGYSGISQSVSGTSEGFSESAHLASAFRIASVTSLWGQFANRVDEHKRVGYGVKLDVSVGYEVGRVTRNEALVAAYESGKFDSSLAQATIDYMIERNASLRSHGICLETSFGVPISFGKRVYLLVAMQYSFIRLFLSGDASVAYPAVNNIHAPSARLSLGFHLGKRQ